MIRFVDYFGEVVSDCKEKYWLRERVELTTHGNSDRI
jgi:hypothetical protein